MRNEQGKFSESLRFEPLTESNVVAVHAMCECNVNLISHSLDTFQKASLKSRYFKSDFSIVALNSDNEVIGFFMVVLRNSLIFRNTRKVATLKFFVVDEQWRSKGLGSQILGIITIRIKRSKYKCFRMKLDVGVSMPDYLYPGLNPCHSEALFFLKKHGFKKRREHLNLCVDLESINNIEPSSVIQDCSITRAIENDKEELIALSFMPKMYRLSSWPAEIELSFDNTPVSTFIAREIGSNKIVGWATHSVGFPGAFGPTGVSKSIRGKGIGGLLLRWCLWDLKQKGLKKCIIRWVREDTAYFYLKAIGARICELYWTMSRRI